MKAGKKELKKRRPETSNYDITIEKDAWSGGVNIRFCNHVTEQGHFTPVLYLEDLKELRRVVRKAIRDYENLK